MRKALILGGIVVLGLAAFWMVDIPQTVRMKTAILKLLPMAPENLNSTIRAICAGAHSGSAVTTCYLNFYSKEAADIVSQKQKCEHFAERLAEGKEKDWMRSKEPGEFGVSYTYIGPDNDVWEKNGMLLFFPEKCVLFSSKRGALVFTP